MANKCIEIHQVNHKYTNYDVLCCIDFSVEEGSFISIVGPNGGGKTSLLRLILGIEKPSEGSIKVFGIEPQKVAAEWVSYVPQIKTLDRSFPALSYELVANGMIGKWTGKIPKKIYLQAFDILEQIGASHLAEKPLNQLSGGELQRIYLARSFAKKPRLLLLDEPATGIDVAGEKDINKIIDEFRSKNDTTILMVTHDWEAAYHHSDYVLLLNVKQICFDKPDKAFSDVNLRRAFRHTGHAHEMTFGVRHYD